MYHIAIHDSFFFVRTVWAGGALGDTMFVAFDAQAALDYVTQNGSLSVYSEVK